MNKKNDKIMESILKRKDTVLFKSTPENWKKEADGRKPNTVRVLDEKDDRFKRLKKGSAIFVALQNTKTRKIKVFEITDYTEYLGRGIVSYNLEEVKKPKLVMMKEPSEAKDGAVGVVVSVPTIRDGDEGSNPSQRVATPPAKSGGSEKTYELFKGFNFERPSDISDLEFIICCAIITGMGTEAPNMPMESRARIIAQRIVDVYGVHLSFPDNKYREAMKAIDEMEDAPDYIKKLRESPEAKEKEDCLNCMGFGVIRTRLNEDIPCPKCSVEPTLKPEFLSNFIQVFGMNRRARLDAYISLFKNSHMVSQPIIKTPRCSCSGFFDEMIEAQEARDKRTKEILDCLFSKGGVVGSEPIYKFGTNPLKHTWDGLQRGDCSNECLPYHVRNSKDEGICICGKDGFKGAMEAIETSSDFFMNNWNNPIAQKDWKGGRHD